jgi:hypothetical protein
MPDAHPQLPLPTLLDNVHAVLYRRVSDLTFMVALDTRAGASS